MEILKYFYIENIENHFVKSLIVPGREKYIKLQLKNVDPNFPLNDLDVTSRTCFVPESYTLIADKAYNMEIREDDIWVVTYPKSGTTWVQEMIWLLLNNFDFETALSVDLTERSPFLEISGLSSKIVGNSVEKVEKLNSPRLIKSHMPASFLPKMIWPVKPKIIYVTRNPKDVCISYYHHWKGMVNYKGSKDEFAKAFKSDNMNFAPYWDHIAEFNKLKDQKNILFLTYEEMKLNLENVIFKCCEFLRKKITVEQFEKLKKHLSFENMKTNPQVNHSKEAELFKANENINGDKTSFEFLRKGQIGSHKDELSDELLIEFDCWLDKMKNKHNLF